MPGRRGREALVVVRDLVQWFRFAAFLWGVISRGGRGRGREQPALPRSAGRSRCPGDMMIDCCDVGSHVVSESVEGGWLMPGT
jgi:hypothetical protein